MNLPDQNSPIDKFQEFSDIDFIVTDLDGTFIQHGDTIWDQLCGVQAKLHNSHPTMTIATGRTYGRTRNIAEDIRMKKDTPIVLYNGAVVISYNTEKILYKRTIPNSVLYDLCRVIDLSEQNLLAYYLQFNEAQGIVESVHGFGKRTADYDVNGMRINWHNRRNADEQEKSLDELSIRALINDACFDNTDISLFQCEPEPCSILIDKNVVSGRLGDLTQYLKSSQLVSYTDSGSGYFEILAHGVDKGTIFEFIKDKKCIAIGDNDNDVELLRGAAIGVAVANASSTAANSAKYRCQQEGTRGVLELLEVIKVANRYWKREYVQ